MNEHAITQLVGRPVVIRRSLLNAFQEFVPISEHFFLFSTKIMAGKFPEFFLRKFSGKPLLYLSGNFPTHNPREMSYVDEPSEPSVSKNTPLRCLRY